MGVAGLVGGWIQRYATLARLRQLPEESSSFSIDMNGLFHDVFNELIDIKKFEHDRFEEMSEEERELFVFEGITNEILHLLSVVKPTDTLLMYVDGVAPAAKMQQQRKRREISGQDEPEIGANRNCITPGTSYMVKLDNFIRDWIKSNRNKLPQHVEYSSHLVPGEGEHKIMQSFREGIMKEGNHIIYGMDADLVILCSLSNVDNIYLYRSSESDIISIEQVKSTIESKGMTVHEFAFLVSFVGNDF